LEVNRVRGKNIMWLALVALLLAMPAVNVRAQSTTVMYVDPPLTTGLLPGDTFAVSIMVTDVVDLKSWQFEMSFAKYMSEIAVVDVIEGDFLMIGGETYLAKNVDPFHGELRVGCTILGGGVSGVSGSGWLATVIFTVLEAGKCALDLHDTILLDSMGNYIEHTAVDGMYIGPTADVRALLGTAKGRKAPFTAPTTVNFKAQIVNTGYTPLDVRLKYTSVHQGTGVATTLYSGQHLYTTMPRAVEYYYVDSFTADFADWTGVGTSPYLDVADGTSYVEGHNHCELMGVFGFADITLNPGDIMYRVSLEGRTWAASGDTDYDVYSSDFGLWYGSLWGGGGWAWHTPRWETRIVSEIDPSVLTPAGFNAFGVILHHYGTFDSFARLDALRLRVEFIGIDPVTPPVYTIDPYMPPAELPPAMWDVYAFNAGTYITTVELQYLYNYDPRFPQVWLYGDTITTFTWTVK
jgi:hypothetical protein